MLIEDRLLICEVIAFPAFILIYQLGILTLKSFFPLEFLLWVISGTLLCFTIGIYQLFVYIQK